MQAEPGRGVRVLRLQRLSVEGLALVSCVKKDFKAQQTLSPWLRFPTREIQDLGEPVGPLSSYQSLSGPWAPEGKVVLHSQPQRSRGPGAALGAGGSRESSRDTRLQGTACTQSPCGQMARPAPCGQAPGETSSRTWSTSQPDPRRALEE